MNKVQFTMKKVVMGLAVIAMICAISLQSLYAQTSGQELLQKYSALPLVKPEENKLGLSIEGISTGGDSFSIQWKSDSDMIMKNPRAHTVVAALLYFIDPDDPGNIKMGLESEFRGIIGYLDKMTVTLGKPAKSIIIYFAGADSLLKDYCASITNHGKSQDLREKFCMPPLFFMAELGDTPRLLDPSPRYADDSLRQIVKKYDEQKEAKKAK